MARSNALGYRLFMCLDGEDEAVPLESVPAEKMEEIKDGWAQRLSDTLSRHYTAHPEEYERLNL